MDTNNLAKVGPKEVIRGMRAVCSSSQPRVSETMLEVMSQGGNAVDAAIAGCLIQAVIEPHMTNHAGTVSFLYWDAKSKKAYQLNGTGTFVPGLAPFRPVPPIGIRFASKELSPAACIPGFIPALGEMHQRFGSKTWSELCTPAIYAAENGHPVTSFEYGTLTEELSFYTYFPSGRELFTPTGFLPEVGEIFRNPALAKTLNNLSKEGPSYFTEGLWAKNFIKIANLMGWPITLQDMVRIPPRWQEPIHYSHGPDEIYQYSPPERTGVFTAIVLGIMSNYDLKTMGHYSESAETLYLLAHALRRAHLDVGQLYDPEVFDVPIGTWLSPQYHSMLADIIWHSRPRKDLSEHIHLTVGSPVLAAAGVPLGDMGQAHSPGGSCELSIVDQDGNWVQMMNTLQSGGIPGMVVDGVPMVGSHARTNLQADIAGWFAGGGRIKSIAGSTIVTQAGQPWLALGSPGNVYGTIPQVLGSILDYQMDPYQAVCLPRLDPLRDDYVIEIESRLSSEVVLDLARMGIQVRPLPMFDYNIGSFQMSWCEPQSNVMSSSADPRRAGTSTGYS